MKTLLGVCFAVCGVLVVELAIADQFVRGHVKKDGTYVAPHVRSSPNSIKADNYGSSSSRSSRSGYDSVYSRDDDDDGISNQYDYDDDNDGLADDSE